MTQAVGPYFWCTSSPQHLLVNGIASPGSLRIDGCRPAGDRRTRDFTMRALRRGMGDILRCLEVTKAISGAGSIAPMTFAEPSRRPAPPHSSCLLGGLHRWPLGNSGESRNLRNPNLIRNRLTMKDRRAGSFNRVTLWPRRWSWRTERRVMAARSRSSEVVVAQVGDMDLSYLPLVDIRMYGLRQRTTS